MRCTRSWAIQNGMVPINLALAADGTLVYILPDRLCLKDLYKPWPDPSDKEVQAGGERRFPKGDAAGSIADCRGSYPGSCRRSIAIGALCSHSLIGDWQAGPLRYRAPDGEQDIDRILVAGKSEKVAMRVVGSHLYLVSAGHLYSYNLDHPGESWGIAPDSLPFSNVRDVTVAKNWLSVIEAGSDDPQAPVEAPQGQGPVNPNVPPVPLPSRHGRRRK